MLSTILAVINLSQTSISQDQTYEIVSVLASAKISSQSIPTEHRKIAGDEIDSITINGKLYHIARSENLAGLIDANLLKNEWIDQLTQDINKTNQAIRARDREFSIVRECSAFVQSTLMTINPQNTVSLGKITLISDISIHMQNATGSKRELNPEPKLPPAFDEVALNQDQISALIGRPFTPALPFHYVISSITATPSIKRGRLESKMIEKFYELREAQNKSYQISYNNLASSLNGITNQGRHFSEFVGKKILDLQPQEQTMFESIFRENGEIPTDWKEYKVARTTSRIRLKFNFLSTQGQEVSGSFLIPPNLF